MKLFYSKADNPTKKFPNAIDQTLLEEEDYTQKEVMIRFGPDLVTPNELLTILMRRLFENIENHVGFALPDVMLTCPSTPLLIFYVYTLYFSDIYFYFLVSFNSAQRVSLKHAALAANFKV